MAFSVPIPWWIASPLAAAGGIGLIVAAAVEKWPHGPVVFGLAGGLIAAAGWLLYRGASGSLSGRVTPDSGEATVTFSGLEDLDIYVILGLVLAGLLVGVIINFA
jgi:hypothetical protein